MSQAALDALAEEFLSQIGSRQGELARPNGTFFSYRVATTAIQRLRLDVVQHGRMLNEKGERFLGGISAYLARIAVENWRRRGLDITIDARGEAQAGMHRIKVAAARTRDGAQERYEHDFFSDARELLVQPPQWFPWIHGQMYAVESLVLPSPEYLLLYGAVLMQSPRDLGNWPKPGRVGGLDSDFDESKKLLVDDLHTDCGLPLDHEGMRKLSWWIVFPPYGWHMNEGQDYNMMTLFSQISHKQEVTPDEGLEYLRGLLRCQALYLQNFAARCLMVYRQPPQDAFEAEIYRQALAWRDHREAAAAMAKYQWQLEAGSGETPPSQKWLEETQQQHQEFAHSIASDLTVDEPAFTDPDYLALESLPDDRADEGVAALERLVQRYPNSWYLKTLYGSQLMKRSARSEGEQILRSQISGTPPHPEAHLRLGTLLKHQGRMDDALQVFEDGVRRWPRHSQLVDSCMWIVTEGMTVERPPMPEHMADFFSQVQNVLGR